MSVRSHLSVTSGLLLAAPVLSGLPASAEAQFGKRLKDAVKRTAEDKVIQKTTEAVDGAAPAAPVRQVRGGAP